MLAVVEMGADELAAPPIVGSAGSTLDVEFWEDQWLR